MSSSEQFVFRYFNCDFLELESWGDKPDTLALYQTAGFETLRQEISYRLDVDA